MEAFCDNMVDITGQLVFETLILTGRLMEYRVHKEMELVHQRIMLERDITREQEAKKKVRVIPIPTDKDTDAVVNVRPVTTCNMKSKKKIKERKENVQVSEMRPQPRPQPETQSDSQIGPFSRPQMPKAETGKSDTEEEFT